MIALAAVACGSAPPAVPVPSPPPAPSPVDAPVIPGPELVGVCDASAAVAIDRFLVVADDEHNVLRVFDWAAGAAPAGAIDLAPFGLVGEADLEGMATATDGTTWITGSHDSGKGDVRKPERQVLVGLRLTATAAGVEAARVAGPTGDFIEKGRWTNPLMGIVENTDRHPSKDPLGLSIEGLAAGPDGSVVFGFRAPIHAGKALFERLDDPAGLAAGGEPKITGPRWADLGGLGVRSVEVWGPPPPGATQPELLIVAGPAGEGSGFSVFRWAGFDERSLSPVRLPVAFGDLEPEGLVRIADQWWVISDDGGRTIGSARCKELPEPERRARTARLP